MNDKINKEPAQSAKLPPLRRSGFEYNKNNRKILKSPPTSFYKKTK